MGLSFGIKDLEFAAAQAAQKLTAHQSALPTRFAAAQAAQKLRAAATVRPSPFAAAQAAQKWISSRFSLT